jgi:hypothetical protein
MANIVPGTPTAGTMPLPAIKPRDLVDDLDQVSDAHVWFADVSAAA